MSTHKTLTMETRRAVLITLGPRVPELFAFVVDPVDDPDKVRDEAGDVALDQDVVTPDHVHGADVRVVLLGYD